MRIFFTQEVEYNGIPAYRFQVGDDFLRDVGPEYGNECFCLDRIEHVPTQPNGCLHKGAMDLSACQGLYITKFVFLPKKKRISPSSRHQAL